MSFLKSLFNDSNEAEESEAASEKKMNSSSASGKMFPVIKTGNWEGIEQGAIKQTIIGAPENPVIIVAFAYDEPNSFRYMQYQDIKEYLTAQNIVDEAYRNIDAYPSKMDPHNGENGIILTASGNVFSSEKILCSDFMNEAHELLHTDTLIVSIARRTCMSIVNYYAGTELMEDFKKIHYHTYADDSYNNPQITDGFFIVKEGAIVDFVQSIDEEPLSELQITAEGEILDEYEEAKQLYSDKKYEESKAKLLDIISKNPEHYEAQNYLAFLFDRIDNNYPEAEKYYLMSLKNNSDYGASNLNFAGMLTYLKRFDESKKYLEKSELLDVNKSTLAFEWAYYYEQIGQFDKAIAYYKKKAWLIYDIEGLEDTLRRIQRCKKKKLIMES